jgi:hypothetical protein
MMIVTPVLALLVFIRWREKCKSNLINSSLEHSFYSYGDQQHILLVANTISWLDPLKQNLSAAFPGGWTALGNITAKGTVFAMLNLSVFTQGINWSGHTLIAIVYTGRHTIRVNV